MAETAQKSSYDYDDLIACGKGDLFPWASSKLPKPPMLMFDRIVHIDETGGKYGKGIVEAELDIKPNLWFFDCHFEGDPVMPGCLGLDALWQLVGFFLAWKKQIGRGRALGVGKVRFSGMILKETKTVSYRVHMRRVFLAKSAGRMPISLGDGEVLADGEKIYEALDLRAGLIQGE